MKAIIIESFGGPEVLKLVQIPAPKPLDHEVLIQVEYAAVNPVDWKIREGLLKSHLPHQFPLILGWDVSGTIAAVGKNVHDIKVGDEVYAYCRKPIVKEGTFADFVCFDESLVALKPKNCSFAESAAIPLVALTAWQALFDFAHLKPHQKVLIHAGSGGVGSFAIQFAKLQNLEVTTTCSTKNELYVKGLGADHVIDYTKGPFQKLCKDKFDFIFDTVGGTTLKDSLPLAKEGGTLVSIVEPITGELGEPFKVRTGFVFVRPSGEQLKEIAHLIEQGKIQVPTITEFTLDDAVKALELSKAGHTQGKMVLKVSP